MIVTCQRELEGPSEQPELRATIVSVVEVGQEGARVSTGGAFAKLVSTGCGER